MCRKSIYLVSLILLLSVVSNALAGTARGPDPPEGAVNMDPNTTLSWTASGDVTKYKVYFGTNEADVAAGTGGTYKSRQSRNSYDPGTLEPCTTYFWRIDTYVRKYREVDFGEIIIIEEYEKLYEGNVWEFSTIPCDIGPPITIKEYGEPYYTDGVNGWITSETPIYLNATDEGSGVDYTKYRVWYNGEWTDWFTYARPFTMDKIDLEKDCLHKIEYYSVDNAGNEESWQEVMVEADAAEFEAYSALAIDPFALRTTHVVYTEEGSQDLIYEISSDFGETWTGKTVLVSGLAEASEPDIQIGPNGDIHIVFAGDLPEQQKRISHIWYDFAANNYSYGNATDPRNWEDRVLVDDTGRDNVYPQIAIDSLNNVHCVWIGDSDGVESGGAQDIFYSRFDGSGWSPRITLYANATTTPGWPNPQIIWSFGEYMGVRGTDESFRESHDLHVIFLDCNEHKMKYLMYNSSLDEWGSYYGGSWSPGVADNVGNSSASYGTVAGMAIEGDILHIAWQDVRDGDGKAYENTRDLNTTDAFGTEWQITFEQFIDDDETTVGETLMGSGKSDNLHLFYRDSVGYDIWYMEYSSAWSIPVKVADSGPEHMHLSSEMAVDNFDSPLLTYTKATNDYTEFDVYYKKPYHNQVVRVDNTPPTTKKTVSDTTITLEAKDNCHCEKYAILVSSPDPRKLVNDVFEGDVDRAKAHLRSNGWKENNIEVLKGEDSTIKNVLDALQKIADKKDCCILYFYFSDHGSGYHWEDGNEGGREDGSAGDPKKDETHRTCEPEGKSYDEGICLADGILYDDEFCAALCKINCCNIVVVLDSCFSGGFVPDVQTKCAGKNIEICTSSGENEHAPVSPSYSDHFYDALKRGLSVEKAHEYARKKLKAYENPNEGPEMYDSKPTKPKFLYCCGVGSYQIHYRIWHYVEPGQELVGELNQPVSFGLAEPGESLIEYWAVDDLGNEEEHHFQLGCTD